MKGFLLVIAYLCIWTTPFQIAFFFWGLGVGFTSEATVLSLTNAAFLSEFLPWFYAWLKPLTYFIFPDVFASFIWALPFTIHVFLKGFFSTWLGLWLLPIAKRMKGPSNAL